MNESDLVNMKLHEIVTLEELNIGILRVYNGWLYWSLDGGDAVFVPEDIA